MVTAHFGCWSIDDRSLNLCLWLVAMPNFVVVGQTFEDPHEESFPLLVNRSGIFDFSDDGPGMCLPYTDIHSVDDLKQRLIQCRYNLDQDIVDTAS